VYLIFVVIRVCDRKGFAVMHLNPTPGSVARRACDLCVCRFFETFSFLPPLDDGEISRQVDYIIANGWTPCLEFAPADSAYVAEKYNIRFGNSASPVRCWIYCPLLSTF
jgi:Ribulose bisphosphate carboxylase, small chain